MTASASSEPISFQSPDCIKCLRRKLDALGIVVFCKLDDFSWHVADFESDTPSEDSEFQFNYMISIGLPSIIDSAEDAFVLNGNSEIQAKFPGINALLSGTSIVAGRVKFNGSVGVRIAWRDASQPFGMSDIEALQCFGQCADDCIHA